MNDKFEDRDEFKRKGIGKKLINLLESEYNISPLVIDGRWGSGKTEFCRKVINLALENDNLSFTPIYINAFQYDYTDEPLIMLISSILKTIKNTSKKKSLISKAIPLVKCASKIVAKAGASWILRTNSDALGDDLSKALNSESDNLVNGIIADTFKNFENFETNIEGFKKLLQNIVKEKRIVIFIDELDRCRPNFALSLLEIIKHIFDVHGVKFVFVTNLDELEKVVLKQYGPINSREYLSKFFKFEMKLPETFNSTRTDSALNSYLLFMGLIGKDSRLAGLIHEPLVDVIKLFFIKSKLSLRNAEKLHMNLQLLNAFQTKYSINEKTQYGYASIIFIAAFIFTFIPDLSDKIIALNVTSKDISELFGLDMNAFNNFSEERDFTKTIYGLIVHDIDPSKISQQTSSLCMQYSNMLFKDTGISYRPGIILRTLSAVIKEMHLSPVDVY